MSKVRKWRIEMLQQRLYKKNRQYNIMAERLGYSVDDLKSVTKENRITYVMDICILENIIRGGTKMIHISRQIHKITKLLELIK